MSLLFFISAKKSFAEIWPYYDEMPHPALKTAVQSMIAHQRQWYNFALYTLHMDTPGYVEAGGYNYSKNGRIAIKSFFRWRQGPPEETFQPLDAMIEAGNRGFFCVRLPTGKVGYTLDGRFRLDNKRRLILLASEFPVLSESETEIILPEGKDIAISVSGLIFVDNAPVDKIKVIVFESESNMNEKLETINGTIFFAPEDPPRLDPKPVYQVRQGFIRKTGTIKALMGDGTYAKYGNESSAKAARSSMKMMTTVIQMANP